MPTNALTHVTYETSQILAEVNVIDDHFHNRERWFGKLAVQTATDWGDPASLALYRAISGNGVYGTDLNDEAQVLGADDTPAQAGMTLFDIRRILVVAVSSTTAYVCRVVWGTGTLANAVIAGQYTEFAVIAAAVGPLGRGSPMEVIMPRLAIDTKTWLQCKNATDNATIDFLVGIHEYNS